MSFSDKVSKAREAFNSGKTKPLSFREQQLKALLRMYEENIDEIVKVVHSDLGKSRHETLVSEVNIAINDLRDIIMNFKDWAKPMNPSKALANTFDGLKIYSDPYGVALVISAWNYPLQLCLVPVAGAIAAGNCVVIKPSELAPETAKFVAETVPKYLDDECVSVVCGGAAETSQLLRERFDFIFFTGSTAVGRIVHRAANEHLTPLVLELGGKSPVYVDGSVNMEVAARRLIWGKFLNAGQTCIAPDYLLCTKEVQDRFITIAKRVLREFYGDDVRSSRDFGRIVNDSHFDRLLGLLRSGDVAIGGQTDPKERYVAPTVLINVKADDAVMQEEIFGPILPIVLVRDADEAIDFVNKREKPLSLYVFSSQKRIVDAFLSRTSSGTVCVNDTVLQFATENVPFGGVGASGMGNYHGKYTFDSFSHKKTCLIRNYNPIGEFLGTGRYPPSSEFKTQFLASLVKKRDFKFLWYSLWAVLIGCVGAYLKIYKIQY